jgi:lysophospholipase L1-like esterase
MKTVICFGDSNTHGSMPMRRRDDHRRFGPTQRWPGVMRQALGECWQVIEEGLPGRTIGRDDPVEGADRNALRYLRPCLQTHGPLNLVVFMLGTNDLKARFAASPYDVAEGVHALIDTVREQGVMEGLVPQVLIVSPAPLIETGCLADMFTGGANKSRQLAVPMKRVAQERQACFLDAADHIGVSALDGIHLDVDAHHRLGQAVADKVREMGKARARN